ncbi:thiol:disulfide interchange protein DsbA/DsbL [Wenzhouxiangella sp. AB-CW3]|uniref:thiol:disulfide interchange protein DsbA/DsbL n=1 Tax=Wenzhouxiangella sp. AB-CW3 TaxID=2771012 RepID=UPI00168AC1E2|nr:thiol:disulfide interchange protein DsbA/DsbL [Wenzhouxiangella sp. AB-CW3]QOC22332.1 thiol:disulfide interchange protein DsbA/DsbL [Wenzhouxiangella sp. AB-CW3]
MLKFSALSLGFIVLAGTAMAESFREGEHYHRVVTPVSVSGEQVEVVEAFAYPCPACRNFLPHIKAWEEELDDNVNFRRLPVALQRGWDLFARAYYTAQVMDIDSAAHEALFNALHDEGRQFQSFDDIADFYAEFGVEAEEFLNTSESFAVDSRMRQNRNLIRQFGIRSTPTMIVHGKWRVQPNRFDSYQDMLEAVQYLVEREAAELETAASGDEDEQGAAAES